MGMRQGCATRPLVYFVLVFTTGLRDRLCLDVALGKGRVSVGVSQSVIRSRVRTYGCVLFQFRDPDEKLEVAMDRVGWAAHSCSAVGLGSQSGPCFGVVLRWQMAKWPNWPDRMANTAACLLGWWVAEVGGSGGRGQGGEGIKRGRAGQSGEALVQ
jgi:hypothetical protein